MEMRISVRSRGRKGSSLGEIVRLDVEDLWESAGVNIGWALRAVE